MTDATETLEPARQDQGKVRVRPEIDSRGYAWVPVRGAALLVRRERRMPVPSELEVLQPFERTPSGRARTYLLQAADSLDGVNRVFTQRQVQKARNNGLTPEQAALGTCDLLRDVAHVRGRACENFVRRGDSQDGSRLTA